MKRFLMALLMLALTMSVTAFAGDFHAGVVFDTDDQGNKTFTVEDSTLFDTQQVTLTVDCALPEAYVVYEGEPVDCKLEAGKMTFSVIGGGTYTLVAGTPPARYTVTYTDGVAEAELFADRITAVYAGGATPAFGGTPERAGYLFTGWSPAVAETVTGDATYTAQWEAVEAGFGTGEAGQPQLTVDTPENLPAEAKDGRVLAVCYDRTTGQMLASAFGTEKSTKWVFDIAQKENARWMLFFLKDVSHAPVFGRLELKLPQ